MDKFIDRLLLLTSACITTVFAAIFFNFFSVLRVSSLLR
jgi:hypothetical protein